MDENTSEQGLEYQRELFQRERSRLESLIDDLVDDLTDDSELVLQEAQQHFEAVIADSPYLDAPEHPMAASLFPCNIHLAVYLALRDRGVDVHRYGAAMLAQLATATLPAAKPPPPGFVAALQGPGTHPGEFQLLEQPASGDEQAWSLDITACAVCHQFARFDAMSLVPYMCATDDVVSDLRGEGLRRTNTIALGGSCCDFRFHIGGEPQKVAELRPDAIKFVHE